MVATSRSERDAHHVSEGRGARCAFPVPFRQGGVEASRQAVSRIGKQLR
ncbi:hypothetical protein DIQ79_30275 [Mycolicibacterium smegmatis]|uniref:Uncharacterized protein n=1 Tax=Mycolicibacterium smegmatis (strain ATCC 700084 / mc(2)155) TaxID=246196 RepID=A0QPJ6_MYCS2|nr:hypothetical protein MSMEG_0421 [Mycolicibacterium smegmatis MC2 155]TBM40041.1 hypothetical protein DIQ86_26755 [Mycolicibacterium smegmatis]TBH28242.1 hypothetical protein EYS45_29430 [Mycolicibacterium smegmatis MC2 155]TBM45164.1 hypothetical protein DIQ85_30500 [Mycolicibacterium smegmatis]TBM55014.1 hypothetical protein DIQ83_30250 [Mycolicibacterium smegmatis]